MSTASPDVSELAPQLCMLKQFILVLEEIDLGVGICDCRDDLERLPKLTA
jgi:hypothetical protein